MKWRVEQRVLGERMIDASHESRTCLGHATFIEQRGTLARRLDPLEGHFTKLTEKGRERLRKLQHLLLRLVLELAPDHTCYPFQLGKD